MFSKMVYGSEKWLAGMCSGKESLVHMECCNEPVIELREVCMVVVDDCHVVERCHMEVHSAAVKDAFGGTYILFQRHTNIHDAYIHALSAGWITARAVIMPRLVCMPNMSRSSCMDGYEKSTWVRGAHRSIIGSWFLICALLPVNV